MSLSFSSDALHAYLDVIGLPWRLPRVELMSRYGVVRHSAYQSDVIEIGTRRPLVDGLLWPLWANVAAEYSPRMPAIEFFGAVRAGDDARENLRQVVAQFEPLFGAGTATADANSLGHVWQADAARVVLHVWPADMQGAWGSNPAHEREPRLDAACSLQILTGFRPPLSEVEKRQLAGFEQIAELPVRSGWNALDMPAAAFALEYIRQPEPEFDACNGWIGWSADRSALIVGGRELLIMPMHEVLGFDLDRVLPAKGGGGAWLSVECRYGHAELKSKRVVICAASAADDLTRLAERIAEAAGKPLTLQPYQYDV